MTSTVGGCLLNERLSEKGWTQQHLAEITGIDFRQISQWATNGRVMRTKNLFIVANALKCDPRTLYENGYRL